MIKCVDSSGPSNAGVMIEYVDVRIMKIPKTAYKMRNCFEIFNVIFFNNKAKKLKISNKPVIKNHSSILD